MNQEHKLCAGNTQVRNALIGSHVVDDVVNIEEVVFGSGVEKKRVII
jgi:hypothetical protein